MVYSLSSIANGIGKLQKITKELSEVELREAVLEQKSFLLDAKEEILALREKVSSLEAQIFELQSSKIQHEETLMVSGYRFDEVNGSPVGQAYCPKCEVSDDKLYRLTHFNGYYSDCPNCKTTFPVGENGRVNESQPMARR